jgi:tetratricopeptide (TPR) repeat protein
MPSDRLSSEVTDAESPHLDAAPGFEASLDDVERTLLAQLYFAGGAWQEGLAVARRAQREMRGLALVEARARFGLGERDAALAIVDRRLAEQPNDVLALYHKAQFLSQSGRTHHAIAALVRLVELVPDFPGALQSLALLSFPGPPYRELLKRVHDRLRPRSYLEIGVEHGTTLALAVHSERVVGVDPVPKPPTRELPRGTRLFHTTSDSFFAEQRCEDIFGERTVDLAFIDGMHWFEYALRDFHNVERWCARTSTVVLHDCLPAAPVAASRQRRTSFWVGDTWKALEYLLRERPDLEISIIPSYPSGLVVIQNLDPGFSISNEALGARMAHYLPLEYPYAAGAWPSHYSVVPNAEPHLAQLLASLGRARGPEGPA